MSDQQQKLAHQVRHGWLADSAAKVWQRKSTVIAAPCIPGIISNMISDL
jgi:hypothetical protein